MRIAYLTHPLTFQRTGGLQNHVRETMAAVTRLGHTVKYFCDWDDSLHRFDLLHYFGCHHGAHVAISAARGAGVPVVLTSMLFPPMGGYWSPSWRLTRLVSHVASRSTGKFSQPELHVSTNWRHKQLAISRADAIAAWGAMEAEMLRRWYQVPVEKITVVPLGLPPTRSTVGGDAFREAHSLVGPFVLMPSSVNPRKNQLAVIRALRDVDVKIVMLGGANKQYLEKCLAAGGDRVIYCPPVPADSPLLASAYKAATVVACVSHCESGPLVALESLASGTPVLLTKSNGLGLSASTSCVVEVDPTDLNGIRSGIETLISKACDPALCRAAVAERTWDAAARILESLYTRATLDRVSERQ